MKFSSYSPPSGSSASTTMSAIMRGRSHPALKILFVVVVAFLLWSFNHPDSERSLLSSKSRSFSSKVERENTGYSGPKRPVSTFRKVGGTCTKTVTNVVFLKTHKTGSSTMSNIMLRFADTHNLTVALPLKGHWELGAYPAYIDKRLIDPQLPKYDIIGHHFRFNIENLREIVYPETQYITIIRAPKDNVESVFGFFVDQSPFNDWLANVKADTTALRLQTFYDKPDSFFTKDTDWYFRSKNHMFFDNGYDVSNTDEAYIDSRIQEMSNIFSLVLITDFFDESLIMLKHKLCWDWQDIVYIKFKMRIEEAKTEVNEELGEKILKWNRADMKLYDHFNKTFWAEVDKYGRQRMEDDLKVFQEKRDEAEDLCIDSYQPFKKKPWMLGAKLKKKPSDYCRHLAWSETVYGEHLREKMYSSIDSITTPTEEEDAKREELFQEVAAGALRTL